MTNMDYYSQLRPTTGRSSGHRWTGNQKIGLGAGLVVGLMVLTMIIIGKQDSPTGPRIVWIAEKTTRAPGVMPDQLRTRLNEAASSTGGNLAVFVVGSKTVKLSDVPLSVQVDGDPVTDSDQIKHLVDTRLMTLSDQINDANVGPQGFSLYEALKSGADEVARRGGPLEVWLTTTVLASTTNPLSVRKLTGDQVDPNQAVDEVTSGPLGRLDLHGVHMHIVLLTPIGTRQLSLGPRSEAWRITFVTRLARKLGATVDPPVPDPSRDPAWENSSNAPLIVPMAEVTPKPPPKPTNPYQPPPPPKIDNAAFWPGSAQLMHERAVKEILGQVVAFQRANSTRYRIVVTGFCARYGKAVGARTKSLERANTIAKILRSQGVATRDIITRGRGFDALADPSKGSRDGAQRVVVIALKRR